VATWSEEVLERLRSPRLEALAAEPGVWIVGGAVRDALLGLEPHELDLVVEGDAVAVARRLGSPVTVHDRFGTATVDGTDLATARAEAYERPGALPTVRPATIEEDLRRRDFTVNAMAVRLADAAGLAVPHAHEDLEAGVLRVLHPLSFVDDPTRLLRLARYAGRLGFGVEPGTGALARAAIAAGALGTVTGSRLGAELRLLLAEPQPAALDALAERGLGEALLGPRFRVPASSLGEALLGAPDVRERLDALAFPAPEREALVRAAAADRLVADLRGASRSQIAERARHEPVEALDVAVALGSEEARWWRDEGRHVRLRITGDDLLAAGLSGPAVGAGLAAALGAVLEGRAASREDELAAALDSLEA
jgi:tRNA nucleotidyltransferase (CCA-adding enzyme)